MKVKEKSEKTGLKLNIQKTKIMASSLITSWQQMGKQRKQSQTFSWAPKSLETVTATMKLKDTCSLEERHKPRLCIKKHRFLVQFAYKGPHSQFSLVAQSCPTLCDPMNCSTTSLPVHHQLWSLLKLMSIESVMPSNHLILCHPLLLLSSIFLSIRVFSRVSSLHQMAKVFEFQLQHQSFQ